MKIVECIHSLQPGGAERLLVDLSNELSSKNEVIVLTLKNREYKNELFYRHELYSNIRFLSLGFDDGFHFSYLIQMYRTIRSLNPDVVHIHCILQYMILAIFCFRKCKYVQTLHNEAEYGIPRKLKRVTAWLVKRGILKMVTISDTNRKSFEKYMGLYNDILIYNGRKKLQKTSLFLETQKYVDSIKTSKDDCVLLCIAKCTPQKNVSLLIEAVNELVTCGISLKLLIIGDNYSNSDLGRKWISMAQNNPCIYFLGPRKNVADYYYLCDGFCLSSLYEGMPITLIEALACGCVPISTPVSGFVDLIEDGKNGFLSKDFTKESYCKTLYRFLKNGRNMSKELLYEKFYSNFSIEKCAKEYMKVFLG